MRAPQSLSAHLRRRRRCAPRSRAGQLPLRASDCRRWRPRPAFTFPAPAACLSVFPATQGHRQQRQQQRWEGGAQPLGTHAVGVTFAEPQHRPPAPAEARRCPEHQSQVPTMPVRPTASRYGPLRWRCAPARRLLVMAKPPPPAAPVPAQIAPCRHHRHHPRRPRPLLLLVPRRRPAQPPPLPPAPDVDPAALPAPAPPAPPHPARRNDPPDKQGPALPLRPEDRQLPLADP